MNILFLCKNEPNPVIGGIERCTSALVIQFQELGHNVKVLSLNKLSNRQSNSVVSYFPDINYTTSAKKKYLEDFVKRHHIDVIINQMGLDRDLSSLFLSVVDCPKISVIHASPDFVGGDYFHHLWCGGWYRRAAIPFLPILKWRYYRRMNSYYESLINRSDKVVLLSDNYHDIFPALARSPKIRVIPNFTDSVFPSSILGQKSKTILYVGRLERRQKTPGYTLKAYKKVEDNFPDWSLTIVGDGPDMTRYKRMAEKLGIKRIHFTGMVDSRNYIGRSSILCLTSKMEGFPMVLIEAMAGYCVPVSFNSFEAAPDIIENGKTGFLVTPGLVNEFAERLRQLMTDYELRTQMAKAGFEKVRKQFSSEVILSQWMKLLNEVTR